MLVVSVPAAAYAQGSVVPYGNGTVGTSGFTPRIWVDGSPHLGNAQFAITIDRGLAGAAALPLIALGPANLPLLSLTLLVDPTTAVTPASGILGGTTGTPGQGTASMPLPLPATASLEGLALFAQWLVLDPAAGSGIAASDGLRVTLTRGPLVIGASLASLDTFVPPAGPYLSQPTGADPWDLATDRAGTLAFALYTFGPPATGLEIHDLTAVPPVRLLTVAMGAGGRALAVHPDDERLYVVHRQTASLGAISYHDIRRGSPTFGARLGPVTGIANPSQFARIPYADISEDGRVLVVTAFDLFADVRELLVVDVAPTSPTRDRVLRQFHYTGTQMTAFAGVAVSADGRFAFVPGMHANQGRLLRINVQTGAIVNSVTFPGPADRLALDPRERFVAMATSSNTASELVIVSLEPGPGFFTARTISSGPAWLYPVALSADGATAVAPDVANGGFAAYDVASGALTWFAPNASTTVRCVVR
ncbi:MAG: hypothetical protein IPK26_15210 [Planctomycetes bacterium]|nr:hypothetical protein [Planctomycetota bacterium]